VAKAKKKRITSPIDRLDRLARDRAALAANPKIVELLQREAAEKEMDETKKKVLDAIFRSRRAAASSPRRTTTKSRHRPITDDALGAAIKNRLGNGERPGDTVPWDTFCHTIRTDCDAFIDGDSTGTKFRRGFSDDTIWRRARDLMKH
jgi:hypothetical protein